VVRGCCVDDAFLMPYGKQEGDGDCKQSSEFSLCLETEVKTIVRQSLWW